MAERIDDVIDGLARRPGSDREVVHQCQRSADLSRDEYGDLIAGGSCGPDLGCGDAGFRRQHRDERLVLHRLHA